MIIQLLLTLVLSMIIIYVLVQRQLQRTLRWLLAAFLIGGIFLVWAPDHATAFARFIGVGRGTDLLLYFWVVVTLALLLILYLKFVQMNRKITQLARAIALASPLQPSSRPRRTSAADG